MEKEKVLFICTGNSVRSQMAEAILRDLGDKYYEIYSAGIKPAGVHRLTTQVMIEEGISLDDHFSKHVNDYKDKKFDYIIPLCEVAVLSLPKFAGNPKQLNWLIDDPIRVFGPDEVRIKAFRFTRNLLKDKITNFVKEQHPDN